MDKRNHYSQKQVAQNYEHRRFGSRSGSFVNSRELNIVGELFSDVYGKILDVPCGTGRALEFLSHNSRKIIGSDYSLNMLKLAGSKVNNTLLVADAFQLPFRQNSFDGVLTLRFLFHYSDVDLFLKSINRILKENGVLVFDICQWSPRVIFGIFNKHHVGRIYVHRIRKITPLLKKYNFEIQERCFCFLLPATVYRFLPFFITLILEKIEQIVPERFLTRIFLKVKKQSVA